MRHVGQPLRLPNQYGQAMRLPYNSRVISDADKSGASLLRFAFFGYVTDEQNFRGNERFSKLGGERVF
ncbi:MAG: hypothetical protein WA849_05575 [Candidatus Udaeobacter sp.]